MSFRKNKVSALQIPTFQSTPGHSNKIRSRQRCRNLEAPTSPSPSVELRNFSAEVLTFQPKRKKRKLQHNHNQLQCSELSLPQIQQHNDNNNNPIAAPNVNI